MKSGPYGSGPTSDRERGQDIQGKRGIMAAIVTTLAERATTWDPGTSARLVPSVARGALAVKAARRAAGDTPTFKMESLLSASPTAPMVTTQRPTTLDLIKPPQ